MWMLIRSLTILFAIAACIAATFSESIWGFMKLFALACMLQLAAYNIYRQVIILFAKKIANDRIKEYTKQGVEIVCPCPSAIKSLIPIQINADNSYRCLDCNKNVAVKIDVQTFLETQPIDLERSSAALQQVYNTTTHGNSSN